MGKLPINRVGISLPVEKNPGIAYRPHRVFAERFEIIISIGIYPILHREIPTTFIGKSPIENKRFYQYDDISKTLLAGMDLAGWKESKSIALCTGVINLYLLERRVLLC
jgi:hypothetical protein